MLRIKKRRKFSFPAFLLARLVGSEARQLVFLGTSDTTAETLGEAVDTATGINNFLLASVERVTSTTYVNVQRLAQS